MSNFYLTFTQKQILRERQPKNPLFFDCVSFLIIDIPPRLNFIPYEFAEKIDEFTQHLRRLKRNNDNTIIFYA